MSETPAERAGTLGFQSVTQEVANRRLPIDGTIPHWVTGTLLRNGPAQFTFGDQEANHWFDGLAMLQRYRIVDGTVTYTNRFLRTEAYARADSAAQASQFGTSGGVGQRLLRWIRSMGPPQPTDNAPVHVVNIGDHYLAVTESPRRIAFDPETLVTRGEFHWTDELTEHMTTGHFRYNATREETVGCSLEFGLPGQHQYHLFAIPDGSVTREHIASITATGPGYVHSCAVTADHIVLIEPPLWINLLNAIRPGTEGLLDLLDYHADHPARLVVIARDTGEIVQEQQLAPFFLFHHVNAFETDGQVTVDMVTFQDASIVAALSLPTLRTESFAGVPSGQLSRLRVDIETGAISWSQPYTGGIELPTVPQGVRGRPYRYAYAQATDRAHANGLVKVDMNHQTATEWSQRGVYIEEPRMVPHPHATTKDDGVVIATALDTTAETSVLLVFDAETLTELGRATLPHVVPFGFHGRFFDDG